MTDLSIDLDLLDALVVDTCDRLANLTGLPCPSDPATQLQLLGLLETGIRHAAADAVLEALEAGYTDTEIERLNKHQELTP
ncbi:MAG: hypothetical protein ACRDQD_08890 [Nocardioidaceae bacterium]